MTYFVGPECLKCKYTDCVEVCPVDCFYEGAEILVIDPEVCIDCGVCVPACPVDAIRSEDELRDFDLVDKSERQFWLHYNAEKTKEWRDKNITKIKSPLPDHEVYSRMEGKVKFVEREYSQWKIKS
jgi:ferredoxin